MNDSLPETTVVKLISDMLVKARASFSLQSRIQALGALVGAALLLGALAGLHIFHTTESARMSGAKTQLNLALERLLYLFEKAEGGLRLIEDHRDLRAITLEALADVPGMEGGFFSHRRGELLGYAFPTYSGSGPKTDIPEAERATISRLVGHTIGTKAPIHEQLERGYDIILFGTAPLIRDNEAIGAVWLMHRLPGIRNPEWRYYSVTLIAMLVMAVVVAGSAWLIARRLDRAITRMVAGIGSLQDRASLPMPAIGYAELDRVIHAVNQLATTVHLQQAERDQLERQLQQADRLAILGRLVAGVAHEVRNPLSSIRLKLQLVRRGALQPHRIIEAFDVVEKEVSRLDRLVARLLSGTKPETARDEPTDLRHFLHDRLQHWCLRGSELGLSVRHTLLDEGPVVSLDRDRIGQILDNLMVNAVDALSRGGGTIHVSLERHDLDSLCLTVQDSGPGIAMAAREHLFEPFFTTKPHGTGLGLFLSAEMARASGGHLRYMDAPEGGACFKLIFPCRIVEDLPLSVSRSC